MRDILRALHIEMPQFPNAPQTIIEREWVYYECGDEYHLFFSKKEIRKAPQTIEDLPTDFYNSSFETYGLENWQGKSEQCVCKDRRVRMYSHAPFGTQRHATQMFFCAWCGAPIENA